MKKNINIGLRYLSILFAIFLTACGKRNDTAGKYFDITVEDEQIFSEDKVSDSMLLSTFFYGENPAQLWSEQETSTDGQVSLNIWLQQADGERTLLTQGIDPKYKSADWFLDDSGCFYLSLSGVVTKLQDTGEELFHAKTERAVLDICPLPGARLLLLVQERFGKKLMRMDSETGQLSEVTTLSVDNNALKLYWSENDNSLYLLDGQGILELDLENGEKKRIIAFQGTTYQFPQVSVNAFRLLAPDQAELMLAGGIKENLQYIDVGKKKTVLVFRFEKENDDGFTNSYLPWLKEQVAEFNRTNNDYHVVFEVCGNEEDLGDYVTMTGIEMATGKGADIIYGGVVEENVYNMLEKGLFVDLVPYIEETIHKEDYFPVAFDCWALDGKVYGVKVAMDIGASWAADKDLIGDPNQLSLESLMDTLLTYPENASYIDFFESELVLRDFLRCSQSLCGTVDWESGSCDFSGELFSKILQVSKRYGYNPQNAYPALFTSRLTNGLKGYDDSEWLESQGKVMVDHFFDDGRYLLSGRFSILAINANTPHKDGAWQFIRFLLDEDAQTSLAERYLTLSPVSKIVFEKMAQAQLENGPLKTVSDGLLWKEVWSGSYHERTYYQNLGLSREEIIEKLWRTKEEVDEIRTAMEQAKSLPIRIMPILEIIYEEASYYFNDAKSLEEVTAIITNRVQLYLDENY